MFVLVRAVTYATLFIGLVLVFLPSRLLQWTGVAAPAVMGVPQAVGVLLAGLGGALALWSILAFVLHGKGTPAPFDPPRCLVVSGPYELMRNPMYLGAALALMGAALFYRSVALAVYAGAFLILTHVFVLAYEEPTLKSTFGADYDAYCGRVGRWWPGARAEGR